MQKLLIFLFCCASVIAHVNMLNTPESIIYDKTHNRYLVSNYSTGDIIQFDSLGRASYFVKAQNAIQGLAIVDSVVYVGARNMIRGFNLWTAAMVMDVHVTGVSNLNDVTADTSGNLYASDVFGTKIIRIDIKNQTWSVFVEGKGINQPNGLFYDKKYNRILVCSYIAKSQIQAVNLADTTVTIVNDAGLGRCDGITKDKYGRCYVTSWETNGIYVFSESFIGKPELALTYDCGPADISYDEVNNVLAIPLQGCNSWTLAWLQPPVGEK